MTDNAGSKPTEQTASGGTIQFSIDKTKHVSLNKSAKPIKAEDEKQDFEEARLLKNRAVPTEFEDVFSDDNIEDGSSVAVEGVVGIDEVFKQKADMINENFHNETGEEPVPQSPKHLKRIAVVVGIICGAVILSAAAVALIILI